MLDASVLLASEDLDDEHHADARRLLGAGDPLATLDLAYYEVTNVAVHSWHDLSAARRLGRRVSAVADDGGLIHADIMLMVSAATVAAWHLGLRRRLRGWSTRFEWSIGEL